jgi:hypothetical protein
MLLKNKEGSAFHVRSSATSVVALPGSHNEDRRKGYEEGRGSGNENSELRSSTHSNPREGNQAAWRNEIV